MIRVDRALMATRPETWERFVATYRGQSLALGLAATSALALIGGAWLWSRDSPTPIDPETIERLQALGYAHEVEADPVERAGVGGGVRDDDRSWPGLNLLTVGGMSRAELIDAEGRMLQRWQHPETSEWYNVTRLDSGGLFVIAAAHDLGPDEQQHIRDKAEGRTLLRYDEAGRLLWERRLPVHHDIQPTSDGTFVTLTSRFRAIASVHPTAVIEDNGLAILSADGEILDELSLFDVLSAEGAPFEWIPKKAEERADGEWVDLLHANSVFPIESSELAARHEIFGPDKLLVSIRHQNVIVVIDLAKRALVWSWGQGELSGPHDATALDNGHLLVFDNGLGRGWSRVAEVDPISGQIIWEYAADPREDFYTTTRGSCERLPNGNTLIAESDRGRAFEVTRDGEIVWSYAVPYLGRNGKRMSLTRIRRFN